MIYKLSNVKNHQKYSDNITMNVVNLSRIDLATEEQIRKRCRDRKEYYEDLHNHEMAIRDRDFSIAGYRKAVIEGDSMTAEWQDMLASHERVITEQEKLIRERDTQIQSLLGEIEQLRTGS